MMMAGQNVTKASKPKPMGFGSGSRENRIAASKGVMPSTSRINPAQNSLLILKVTTSRSRSRGHQVSGKTARRKHAHAQRRFELLALVRMLNLIVSRVAPSI